MDLNRTLIILANKCLNRDLRPEENFYPLQDGDYYKVYKNSFDRDSNNADFLCHCSYNPKNSPKFTDFRICDSNCLIVIQHDNFRIYSDTDRSNYEPFYTNDEYFNIIMNCNSKITFDTLLELQRILNKSTISTLSFYVPDIT